MRIITQGKNTIIKDVKDFLLSQTLECGQCFRFYKQGDEDYVVVAKNRLLHIIQKDNDLYFIDTDKESVEKIWVQYFDLDRDYDEIKKYLLKCDDILKPAIDEKYGVRLLNQEFHETLISFIISQNNQIPRIKQLVKAISDKYGDYLGTVGSEDYYSFPSLEQLSQITEQDFRELKTGFRAPYLCDAIRKMVSNEISLEAFAKMDDSTARIKLTEIKGVGEKVANCVMLFALNYRSSFPIDVWIKRIMEELYFDGEATKEEISKLAKEKYGEYGGYAQQYLFCFGRDNKVGVKNNK